MHKGSGLRCTPSLSIPPYFFREPFNIRFWRPLLIDSSSSPKEEIPLGVGNESSLSYDVYADHEAEDEFVSFKEATRHVAVNGESCVFLWEEINHYFVQLIIIRTRM